MVDVKVPPQRDYINVMELLVAEEVELQLRQLPTRVLKYVKSTEVETYALNRLPSLYAASEKGWRSQYQKARHELRKDISNAVRQAIAAVQIDPLRASRPLVSRPSLSTPNRALLEQFRAALGQPNLTWESLLRKCQRAGAAKRGSHSAVGEPTNLPSDHYSDTSQATESHEYSAAAYGSGAPYHQPSSEHHGNVWRPGTYGETSWRPKRNHGYRSASRASSTGASNYDWSDSRYR
ncbi:MAG: late competence development ComFB family protein [Cyanobacteria bacterium J06642_11]